MCKMVLKTFSEKDFPKQSYSWRKINNNKIKYLLEKIKEEERNKAKKKN